MNIDTSARLNAINASDLGALRREARGQGEQAIKQVAQQFESLFVQTMLKSMRAASIGDGGMFSNGATKQYRQLFDQQMAMQVSQGEGMGLASMVERQILAQRGHSPADTPVNKSLETYWRNAPESVASPAAQGERIASQPVSANQPPRKEEHDTATGRWQDPRAFVDDIMPAAEQAAAELGVSPRALVAQAALETGWGERVLQSGDGGSTHNLFNIKAHGWSGQRVSVPTLEYRDGVAVRERAEFRAYDSVQAAFDDYAAFLKANPRYQRALEAGRDEGAYVDALQEAGYATDPRYADKLRRILDGPTLNEATTALKNSEDRSTT